MVSPSNCRCELLIWNLFPVTIQYKIKSKIVFVSPHYNFWVHHHIALVQLLIFLFSKLVLSILISETHYFLHSFHYNSFVLSILMKFCFVEKEEMYTHSVSQSYVWMKHSHAHTYVSTHVNISMSRLLVYS